MRTVQHNMIFITFEFADYDFAQSGFINYNLSSCRLWLLLNTTWFLSLPKKIWGTLQCTVASSTLRCTVVGPPSAKQNKSTTAGFELRTFYLDACNPARYPNDPSHPKARLQEEPCLSNNIKSNVQWSTAQWRNGSRVGDETYWTQHDFYHFGFWWLWLCPIMIHKL